jgi:sugar/nucleoside kinase (ribokinase family)
VPRVDLLVIGDCNPDLILSGEDVTPAFGQVERLVDRATLVVGGSAAIVACGAARLGLRTAFVRAVGADPFGEFMLTSLEERGVDVSNCRVDAGASTGVTVILSRPDDRAILTYPGAIRDLTADDVDPDLVRRARHLHVSSYFLQPALRPGLPRLFRDAHAAGATVSVDPNWDPEESWNGGLEQALADVDLFLPNATEATIISGERDPQRAAAALVSAGPATIAVKLGAQGALVVSGGQTIRAQAPDVVVVDATGAGDSFDAGFLTGTLTGRSLEDSLALGCACGSLSTRAVGGTAAQPTLDEARQAVRTTGAGR